MIKLTMLFEQGGSTHGGGRISGWSETWWNNNTLAGWPAMQSRLMIFRAGLLTDKAAIIGYRIKDASGPVQVFRENIVGAGVTLADIPQMSLACYTRTADQSRIKFFRLRGLPDARVENGSYVPSAGFQANFTSFATCLQNEQWGWQGLVTSNPQIRINSIDANGNVVCAAGGTFALNQTVILRRTKNTAGKNVNGRYRVLAWTSNTSFQLSNWIGGTVGQVGTVALYTSQLFLADGASTKFSDVTTQKVGRPFNLYRGRATKR